MIVPQSDVYRVVVIISPGIAAPNIMLDIASAFEHLGHPTFIIDLREFERLESSEEKWNFFSKIKKELPHFDPHFAIGYNASVFIAPSPAHRDRHFFEEQKIPYISLFFDNPMLPQYQQAIYTPRSSRYVIFIWDQYYRELFQKIHKRDAHYLPLAANTDVFKPLPVAEKFRSDVSFIGSIPENGSFRDERSAAGWHPWLIQFAEEVTAAKQKNPSAPVEEIIQAFQNSFPQETQTVFREFMKQDAYTDFLLSIYSQFGYHSRVDALQALAEHDVHVYGGNGWKQINRNGICLGGNVDYHAEAPEVYNSAAINLNITGAQLVTAVNQRVFDVPACNAFLLSDYRLDLSCLFTPDEEVVIFQDIGDLQKKAAYYLHHKDEREEIAYRAHQRVLQEHTYIHRVQSVIRTIRAIQ